MIKHKKALLSVVAAMLVAGTTVFTSCNKEESLTNNVPAMELKNGEGDVIVTKTRLLISPWYLFWQTCYRLNSVGKPEAYRCCLPLYDPYYEYPDSLICGISVNMPDPGMEVAHMETIDGKIKKIVLYSSGMETNLKELFLSLVANGTIALFEDSPITDTELLAQLDDDYIPAGEYPIHLEDDNFVITIAN